MKNIKKILELQDIIIKNKIIIPKINLSELLIDSLAYDGEFSVNQLESIKERNIYIEKNYSEGKITLLQIDIKDILKHLEEKIKQSNNNLLCFFMIQYISENWSSIFGIGSKKIKLTLEGGIFTTEALIKSICNILFNILNKQPLLRYNYTKGLYLSNYLLNIIGLPGIILSYNDRKRILRSIDHYVDFEKEFLLTIQGRLNKIIAEKLYNEDIVDIATLREKRKIQNPYIAPGTWWYGEDRKKYTFIKYN